MFSTTTIIELNFSPSYSIMINFAKRIEEFDKNDKRTKKKTIVKTNFYLEKITFLLEWQSKRWKRIYEGNKRKSTLIFPKKKTKNPI